MTATFADRILETTATVGTGALALAGSPTGFRTFVATIGDGNSCHYLITDGVDFEIGIGTVSAPATLARDTVLSSSNGDAAVDWDVGTKRVIGSPLAADLLARLFEGRAGYWADTGAADAYAIAPAPKVQAYAAGQTFTFKAVNANTGASTLNVNGLGATAIKKFHDVSLAAGDIEVGQLVTVTHDGTAFQMQSPPAQIEGVTLKPVATVSVAGVVELATSAETVTGTDTERAVTPAGLTARLAAPGAIGGTTPAAITGTTLTATKGVFAGAATAHALGVKQNANNRAAGFGIEANGNTAGWALTAFDSGVFDIAYQPDLGSLTSNVVGVSIDSSGYVTVSHLVASSIRRGADTHLPVYTGVSPIESFRFGYAVAGVNYVATYPASTTGSPSFWFQGADTNVGGYVTTKGTAAFQVYTNSASQLQLEVSHSASVTNYGRITGSAGGPPIYGVAGASANIDVWLMGKGSGVLRLPNAAATPSSPGSFTASYAIAMKVYDGTTVYVPCALSLW